MSSSASRVPTYVNYHGRNVKVGSQRLRKIEIWERREAEKRQRRAAKRARGGPAA